MKSSLGFVGFLVVAALGTAQAQTAAHFTAYSQCRFTDDLALVEATPLADGVQGRTVRTIMGDKRVPLTGGTRLMYAYPGTEPIANVKVEQIPGGDYVQAKQDLIANFNQILNGDDSSTRNYALEPRLNGLEIYGLDRKKLEGGVLGIYLFFADRAHIATTVYFLNQEPAVRKFDSLEGYAILRDAFLKRYTACASGHARPGTVQQEAVAKESAAEPAPAMQASTAPAAAPATALPDAPQPQGAAAAYIPADAAPLVSRQPASSKAVSTRAKGSVKKTTAKTPAKAAQPRTKKAVKAKVAAKTTPDKAAKTDSPH